MARAEFEKKVMGTCCCCIPTNSPRMSHVRNGSSINNVIDHFDIKGGYFFQNLKKTDIFFIKLHCMNSITYINKSQLNYKFELENFLFLFFISREIKIEVTFFCGSTANWFPKKVTVFVLYVKLTKTL